MGDDIVTKLRDFTWDWDDLRAAADEIERLRAAGDALADMVDEVDALRLIQAWNEARQ